MNRLGDAFEHLFGLLLGDRKQRTNGLKHLVALAEKVKEKEKRD
jgi:hypothetical protein